MLGTPRQQSQPGEEAGKEIGEKENGGAELLLNTEAGEEEAH